MSKPDKYPRVRSTVLLDMPTVPQLELDLSVPFVATDLEVSTISPRSAVITWITRRRSKLGKLIPAPVGTSTQLKIGTSKTNLKLVHDDPTPTAFHRVFIKGLEPGRRYFFAARSAGVGPSPNLLVTRRAGSVERTFSFVTLVPPPGRYLTSLVLANDIHVGETRQGINLGPWVPTSVAAADDAYYPETMFRAMLDELDERGHPTLLLAGDLTYNGTAPETARFVDIADSYGRQGKDWLAVRGNHDWPRGDDPLSTIVPYQKLQTMEHPSGLRITGIDTTYKSGGGRVRNTQFKELSDVLATDPDRPTLSFGHHPVTQDAVKSWPGGQTFMLRRSDRLRLQRLHRSAPGVFLHFAGHTHRMRREQPDTMGAHTAYLENAAVAAYPGGYSLLHLYEGGYLVNFWRTSAPEALAWTYRSRWQMMGFGPHLTLGKTEDRNHVGYVDLSGLTPTNAIPEELDV